jgi:hypothetical protein
MALPRLCFVGTVVNSREDIMPCPFTKNALLSLLLPHYHRHYRCYYCCHYHNYYHLHTVFLVFVLSWRLWRIWPLCFATLILGLFFKQQLLSMPFDCYYTAYTGAFLLVAATVENRYMSKHVEEQLGEGVVLVALQHAYLYTYSQQVTSPDHLGARPYEILA